MRPDYDELVEMFASNPEVLADDVFDYYEMSSSQRYIIVKVYGNVIAKKLSKIWNGLEKQ